MTPANGPIATRLVRSSPTLTVMTALLPVAGGTRNGVLPGSSASTGVSDEVASGVGASCTSAPPGASVVPAGPGSDGGVTGSPPGAGLSVAGG